MSKQTTLIQATFAALLLAFASSHSAHAAPQDVVKLPRVVVTGKAVTSVATLPRVVVTGYSLATQLQQQTLADVAPAPRAI